MGFVSYAQNFEDVMLWRALGHIEEGFYIDVGAQSPDLDSVTRAFSDVGWRGINVEPHPVYHAELVRRRPRDVNLRCALGERPGTAVIHLVGSTGLSTLDPSIATKHLDAGYSIEEAAVPVETLDQVWGNHVPPAQAVHFLKVDVEGFELQVLRGNNWSTHRPWIVIVEATAPNSQTESFAAWEPQLLEADYQFVYKDGLNRFYVAGEHAHLREAFRHPPNVFDGIVPAALKSASDRVAELESSLDSERDHVTQLESSLASERGQVTQLESSLASERGQVTQLESSLASARDQVAQLELSLASARDQVAQLELSLVSASSQLAELTVDRARMRQDLVESELRLGTLEAQHTELRHHENGLRIEIGKAGDALAQAHRNLDEISGRLAAAESGMEAARNVAEHLRREMAELYRSDSWRLTAPLRAISRHSPAPVRRFMRQAAKLVWWILTPWRLPARLRELRGREAARETDSRESH